MKFAFANQTVQTVAQTFTKNISRKALTGTLLALTSCQAVPIVGQNIASKPNPVPGQAGVRVTAAQGFGVKALVGAPSTPVQLGANLGVVNDWSRTLPLVDLAKQARIYGSAAAPWEALPNASYRQLPAGDFGVVLFAFGQGSRGNGGVYHFSFEGRANVRLTASLGSLRNVRYDAATGLTTGQIVLDEASPNLMLSFTQTQGMRNLRVLQPGYALDSQEIFSRRFLDHVRRFKTLRLADWTKVNGAWRPNVPNPDVEWSNRVTPADASFASLAGLPWEYLIQLANLNHQDIWINIPHMASDDYVRQLAGLMRDQLSPDLKIYLEYSNEVWNWGYAQTQWNFDQAQREAAGLAYDGTTNPGYLAWRRTARRIKEISDIFRSVYGAGGFNTRFFPVLAAQLGNPETLRQGLMYLNAVFGPPENYLSAAAGAPYFNHDRVADAAGPLTADQIVEQLKTSVDNMRPGSQTGLGAAMERSITLSRYYNLPLVAYEGGPDTVGSANLEAKRQAMVSPRLEQICVDYLQTWYSWGAGMFMWYQAGATNRYAQSGSFGLLENMSETDTPLNRCMDRMLAQPTPELTAGFGLPGVLDARLRVGRPADALTREQALSSWTWPGYVDYLLRAPQAGRYRLRLNTQTGGRTSQMQVLLNNHSLGNLTIPVGPNGVSEPLTLDLPAGLNVLRFNLAGGTNNGYQVRTLSFETVAN